VRQHGLPDDPLISQGYSPALGFKPAVHEVDAGSLPRSLMFDGVPIDPDSNMPKGMPSEWYAWHDQESAVPKWLRPHIEQDYPRWKAQTMYERELLDPHNIAAGLRAKKYKLEEPQNIAEIEAKYAERKKPPVKLWDVDEYEFQRTYQRPLSDALDYLRQAYTPDELSKVSVPDALRKSGEWHAQMAKKAKDQGDEALKRLRTYKTYPEGGKWVEMGGGEGPYRSKERDGFVVGEPDDEAVHDMLGAQSIGKSLGHCYQHPETCEQYLSGGKLFSYLDPSGKPRATLYAEPTRRGILTDDVKKAFPDIHKEWNSLLFDERGVRQPAPQPFADWLQDNYPDAFEKLQRPPFDLVEMRGPQNAEIPEDALPQVQDFTKSGKWGRVHDAEAADMMEIGEAVSIDKLPRHAIPEAAHNAGDYPTSALGLKPGYVSREELYNAITKAYGGKASGGRITLPEGFADGGFVEDGDAYDYLEGLLGAA
jgi:hypothetical protein